MIDIAAIPVAHIAWKSAVRIIRSLYPPADLFDDIADPADWALLIQAEMKTNPRLVEALGNLDIIPPDRRVAGPGASYLMAPFTHMSQDRPSRFSDGTFGVLYAGDRFEVALLETAYHHGRFMARTNEPEGWTSQFREILLDVVGDMHDLRGNPAYASILDPLDYGESQALGLRLREAGSNGLVYPSVRCEGSQCVGLFYPDLGGNAVQGRHLDYHWNGERVDFFREAGSGEVYRIA